MNFSAEWHHAIGKTARLLLVLLCGGVLVYPLTGVVSIKPDETGVLLRFGKVVHDKLQPGMHFVFPWPIDRLIRVPVRQIRTISIGLFYPEQVGTDEKRSSADEPHLLTGDKNLVQADLTARFSIVDPARFLFSSRAPEEISHDVVASAIVATAASLPVDNLLTIGRLELQRRIKERAQARLDRLEVGILLRGIEVKDVNPPRAVLPHFKAVVNAQMQRNTKRHKAESRRSSLLARAKSLALRKIETAHGEKSLILSKADGEVARFKSLLDEYQRNAGPLRCRLRLENMRALLPRFNQVIAVGGGPGSPAATVRIGIKN